MENVPIGCTDAYQTWYEEGYDDATPKSISVGSKNTNTNYNFTITSNDNLTTTLSCGVGTIYTDGHTNGINEEKPASLTVKSKNSNTQYLFTITPTNGNLADTTLSCDVTDIYTNGYNVGRSSVDSASSTSFSILRNGSNSGILTYTVNLENGKSISGSTTISWS